MTHTHTCSLLAFQGMTRTHTRSVLAFPGITHTHTRSLLMSLSRRGLSLSDATDACRWSAHTRSLSMSLSRLYRCFRRRLSTTAPRNRARRMQVESRSRTARVWLVEEARVQHVKLSSAKALCTHALHGMLLCTRCFQTFIHTCLSLLNVLRHCQRVLWTQGVVHTRTSWNASLYSVLSDFHPHLPLFTECLRHCQRVLRLKALCLRHIHHI